MRFIVCAAVVAVMMSASAWAQTNDVVRVQTEMPQTPVLIDREDNVLFYIRIDAPQGGQLEGVELQLGATTAQSIRSLKLYYAGSDAADVAADKMCATDYILDGERKADATLSVLKDRCSAAEKVSLEGNTTLFRGINYFWVSVQMKPRTSLLQRLFGKVEAVVVDGRRIEPEMRCLAPQRMAVGVRHSGDDGAKAYRIPGIVTTSKGTLLGVYDVRHNSSRDLQGYIDIGLSRSTDGGKSWERMRLPLCFGEWGGLPLAQNGVGDPAILYDHTRGRVWVVAIWCHGMGARMAWHASKPGMTHHTTAQLMMTYSDDDGKTWSQPINVTPQVKAEEWNLMLQGPGRGITMQDGTLVFAFQHHSGKRKMPWAGIIYSKDGGQNWHFNSWARENTTEAQVVELPSGELMLNMRDNRGGSRAVSVTSDLGKTWQEHPSSRSALREPVCMASLIAVRAEDNALGRNILLFSNPDDEKHRRNMTIKLSLDDGVTWSAEHQVLLDADDGWGYSCLTMIDSRTVGILYESSQAHILFQAVPLSDFFPDLYFE